MWFHIALGQAEDAVLDYEPFARSVFLQTCVALRTYESFSKLHDALTYATDQV